MERILAQHFFWLKYLLFRWYSLHKKAVMQIVIIQYGLSHITLNKISQFICKYWNRVKFKLEWTGGKFPKVKKVWYFISMFIVTNHYQIRLFSFISTIELFKKSAIRESSEFLVHFLVLNIFMILRHFFLYLWNKQWIQEI